MKPVIFAAAIAALAALAFAAPVSAQIAPTMSGRSSTPAHLMLAAPAPGTAESLRAAALCYAARHPDQVRALVDNSRAGSEDEFEALRGMAEDFFSCFPESVATGDLDPTVVRYRLIEAALRLPASGAPASSRP